MKKVFLFIFSLLTLISLGSLTSCEHEHTYNLPTVLENGDREYVCTVCDHVYTETHTHTYSKWSSNAGKHWQECTVDGCDQESEREDHVWSFTETAKKPTSEEYGEELYTCESCGRTKTEQIAKLTGKINKAKWENSFEFQNLRVDYLSNYENMGSDNGYVLIDGDNILDVTGGVQSYIDRSELATMDFSDYYDSFAMVDPGVYYADKVSFSVLGYEMTLSEVEIVFDGDFIDSITYSIDMGDMFGVWTQEYYLSKWGQVKVDPPKEDDTDTDTPNDPDIDDPNVDDNTSDNPMPLEEWEAAFDFENVKIEYYYDSSETTSSHFGRIIVLGDDVWDHKNNTVILIDKASLFNGIDFVACHDSFYSLDGMSFYANTLPNEYTGGAGEISGVYIEFGYKGNIDFLSYDIDGGEMYGGSTISFTFYDYGEATLGETNVIGITAALDRSNFDYYRATVYKKTNGKSTIIGGLYFDEDYFEITDYVDDSNTIISYAAKPTSGIDEVPLVMLLLKLDPADFYYDYELYRYVYYGKESLEGIDKSGQKALMLSISLTDSRYGLLDEVYVTAEDGSIIIYDFNL